MPHDPHGDAADRRSADDEAWQQIVDNYGDRVLLDDDPHEEVEEPPAQEPEAAVRPVAAIPEPPTPPPAAPPEPHPAEAVEEQHYVPPPPPPVPRAEPPRLLAWCGLFGSPVVVLLALVARVTLPSWLGLILMVGFVGGFVYLVASMRTDPRDDDDDGAVV